MGKYYEVVVTLENDELEMRIEPMNLYKLQVWIMDLIRLHPTETLREIFKNWELFDFLEDEDDEEYAVNIQYIMHELNYYYFIVFAKSEIEALNKLNYHLMTKGLPEEDCPFRK